MAELRVRTVLALVALVALAACRAGGGSAGSTAASSPPAEAKVFLSDVNDKLNRLWISQSQSGWVAQTYITDDSEAIDARVNQEVIEAVARFAKESTRFDTAEVSQDERRQLNLLKLSLVMAAPSNAGEAEELTRIASRMRSTYGKGTFCPESAKPDSCMNIDAITRVMANSCDEKELRRVWEGWHTISIPMRADYARFVELSNKGAKELGFADTGAMWRSKYDMPPEAFSKELDRLWEQVRPLYLQLHAYVRLKLRQKYGGVVSETGPIPAHLLGNIWAQDWTNLEPLVEPPGVGAGYSLNAILKRRNIAPLEIDGAVMRHPDVLEAATIGVPDPIYGEAIAVYVVAKPGSGLTADSIERHCAAVLPDFKRPREIVMTDAVLRNARGKVDRNAMVAAWKRTHSAWRRLIVRRFGLTL